MSVFKSNTTNVRYTFYCRPVCLPTYIPNVYNRFIYGIYNMRTYTYKTHSEMNKMLWIFA